MGGFKKLLADKEAQQQIAIDLCVEAGAIERCPVHDDAYIDMEICSDAEDLVDEILEDNPQAVEQFGTREEMVEAVQDALRGAGEECPFCDR